MTELARLDESDVVVVEYPVSRARLWELFPGRHNLADASDATLLDLHVVRVADVAAPTTGFGERPVRGTPEKAGDVWRQTWTVETITLAEAKARLREMARTILMSRVEELSSVEHALFIELAVLRSAQDAGDTIVPSNYPLIQSVAASRALTFAAAATFAEALRAQWLNRAGNFAGRYVDVLDRIQAATTIAAAYAIWQELEAIS